MSICQRHKHKRSGLLWEFVCGKVEQGDTKEQALICECKEELDIDLSVGDMFKQTTHDYSDIMVHLTLFIAKIIKSTPKNLSTMILNG